MTWSALQASQLLVIGVGLAGIPPAIRRLPEPAPLELPPAGSAEESELDRVLREEGPTEAYADMADQVRRGWYAFWPLLLLTVCAWHVEPERLGWTAMALAPVLALLCVVDWRRKLLPRIVVLPFTGVVTALAVIDWLIRRDTDALVREAVGGVLAWLVFGVLWFVRKAGMGFGDVRLSFPLGILMAAVSWNAWMVGLYAGFLTFVAFAFGLILIRRDRSVLRRAYPFGPFMIAGAYAGMTLGPHLHLIG